MNAGYIKLFRSLLEWEWYDDKNTKILFLHLLLTVNWTSKSWHGIEIKRGQRLVSIEKLAAELGLSVQNVRTAVTHLKSTGEITIEPTNRANLITVVNYEVYQGDEPASNKEVTSRPTKSQQGSNKEVTTTKEGNKLKEGNKERGRRARGQYKNVYLTECEYNDLSEKYPLTVDDLINRLSIYKKAHNREYGSDAAMLYKFADEDDQDAIERAAYLNL